MWSFNGEVFNAVLFFSSTDCLSSRNFFPCVELLMSCSKCVVWLKIIIFTEKLRFDKRRGKHMIRKISHDLRLQYMKKKKSKIFSMTISDFILRNSRERKLISCGDYQFIMEIVYIFSPVGNTRDSLHSFSVINSVFICHLQ